MPTFDYRSQIDLELQQLGMVAQQKVLEFAKSLRKSPNDPSSANVDLVAQFAGSISMEDLQSMQRAIKDGCEMVDFNEW